MEGEIKFKVKRIKTENSIPEIQDKEIQLEMVNFNQKSDLTCLQRSEIEFGPKFQNMS